MGFLRQLNRREQLKGFSSDSFARSLVAKDESLTPFLDSLTKIAHYDVSRMSSLYQSEDTSSPVTADAQQVGQILDISGNANHLTSNGNSARKPTYRAASASTNSKPCLEFITDDILAKRFLTITSVPLCMIVVGVVANTNNWAGLVNIKTDNDGLLDQYPCNASPNTFFIGYNRQATSTSAFHVRAGYDAVGNSTNRRWRINGAAQTAGGDGSSISGTNFTELVMGARDWASGAVSSGFVSEFIILPTSSLTFAQLTTVEAELYAKWGITP